MGKENRAFHRLHVLGACYIKQRRTGNMKVSEEKLKCLLRVLREAFSSIGLALNKTGSLSSHSRSSIPMPFRPIFSYFFFSSSFFLDYDDDDDEDDD